MSAMVFFSLRKGILLFLEENISDTDGIQESLQSFDFLQNLAQLTHHSKELAIQKCKVNYEIIIKFIILYYKFVKKVLDDKYVLENIYSNFVPATVN